METRRGRPLLITDSPPTSSTYLSERKRRKKVTRDTGHVTWGVRGRRGVDGLGKQVNEGVGGLGGVGKRMLCSVVMDFCDIIINSTTFPVS